MKRFRLLLILIVFCIAPVMSQVKPVLQYRVFLDDAKDHIFHVEIIAGTSLSEEFEYVYTTREMDYNRYLNYAGLELEKTTDENGKVHYSITALEQPGALQNNIQKAWLRGLD